MIMKEAYLERVPAKPYKKKELSADLEPCDEDLTKKKKVAKKKSQGLVEAPRTIRTTWSEKAWDWTAACQRSFDAVKEAIANNACAGTDYDLQFHLATDASATGIGGILFQLHGTEPGTIAGPEHRNAERIVTFLSFRPSDAETRYSNPERECLAVVKCLAEVRSMIMGYPVIIYSDHSALRTILTKGSEGNSRIMQWESRLGEYDFSINHRPNTDHCPNTDPIIGLADGLSRLPTRLATVARAEDGVPDLCCVLGDGSEDNHLIPTIQRPWNDWDQADAWRPFRRSPMYRGVVEVLRDETERLA